MGRRKMTFRELIDSKIFEKKYWFIAGKRGDGEAYYRKQMEERLKKKKER